jgi:Ca-activated chloride channel homolog
MGNYKDSKIQVLAEKGNGNFAYLDTHAEAEKVLMKEFMLTMYAVADGATLDVSFDPAYVKEYRVIGFDNKLGAVKDTSSILDGGEIGSANSMVIAFEIVPANPGVQSMPVQFDLTYRSPETEEALRVTETVQLKKQSFQEVDRNYGFASSVILFGSLLRSSPFIKESMWNEVHALASKYADPADQSQMEFVSLVEQAKAMYYSKKKKKK